MNVTTDATIWTFPLGVTLSKDFETSGGGDIQTQFDLNMTPADGDVKLKQYIRFTNVNTSAEMKSKVLDY